MNYKLGILAVLIAGLCGSSVGVLVRLIEDANGWQILFYRSVSFALLVLVFMVARNGRGTFARFLKTGIWGAVVSICLGSAFIAYIFAVLLTTVAGAVFILSASPFIAALLSWIFLGEKASRVSWACMTAGLLGVAIMMAEGLLAGSVLGSAIALIAALGYAASIVAYRAGKDIDMMPATCLAGVFAAIVTVVLVDDFVLSGKDLVIAVLLGTVQVGLQYILITIAARHVPAAEVTLLMLSEVVLAPVWVWIGFGETPALLTLVGGGVVLLAVTVQAGTAIARKQ